MKFSVNLRQEGEFGTIELDAIDSDTEDATNNFCDDPKIVKLMIDYFYHLDYLPDDSDDGSVQLPPFTREEYLVKLNEATKKKVQWKNTLSSVETSDKPRFQSARPKSFIVEYAKVFATAVKCQADGLRHLAASKFRYETTECEAWKDDEFARAVSIIRTSTPKDITDLRDLAEDLLYTHFAELHSKDSIKEVMCSRPELIWAMLKRDC